MSSFPGLKYSGNAEVVLKLLKLLASQIGLAKIDVSSKRQLKLSPTVPNPAVAIGRPIRKGWMHKKRDIISGWRPRYFVVYVGRVEYFNDPSVVIPRGVFPLIGAEITGPRRCSVNGNDDRWCLM